MTIAALVAVTTIVFMVCRFCGKRTRHTVSQSSRMYRDYKCESCQIITKFKIK